MEGRISRASPASSSKIPANRLRGLLLTTVARGRHANQIPERRELETATERFSPVCEALIASLIAWNPHLTREGAIKMLKEHGEL